MHETFMQRALEIARQSLGDPGALPYGSVVVKDGQIIGEGLNRALAKSDPTSHCEIEAIRDACARLGTTNLSGCDLYTTAEPCVMCASVMYLSGIARVYYSCAVSDTKPFVERLVAHDPKWRRPIGLDEVQREVALPTDRRRMPASRMLVAEGQALLEEYARKIGA
jgi:guanine deaminase